MISQEESKILAIDLASDEDKDINVKIDEKTADNLRIAQNANIRTKELLPYGAINMGADIYKTEGKNISLKYNLEQHVKNKPEDNNVETLVKYGVGNCRQFAEVTRKLIVSSGIKEPVFRVAAKNIDHTYILIGDGREKSHVVVADSWVILPVAHLENQGIFEKGEIEETILIELFNDPKYLINDDIQVIPIGDIEPVNINSIHERFKDKIFHVGSSVKKAGYFYNNSGNYYNFDIFPKGTIKKAVNNTVGYYGDT